MGFLVFVAWVAFVFGIGKLAESRGRSVAGWCIFAFFFSPLIAAIIILVLPDLEKEMLETYNAIDADRIQREEQLKILSSDFLSSIQQVKKLHEGNILDDDEYEARKVSTIKGLRGRTLTETPEEFLAALIPAFEKDVLTSDNMKQIKSIVLS